MTSFEYIESAASADKAYTETRAIEAFGVGTPMEANMEAGFVQYPWEASPGFVPAPSVLVAPPIGNMSFVTMAHRRAGEVAHVYVTRIQSQLPETVRDGFVRGTGMFDFAAPADTDDMLG